MTERQRATSVSASSLPRSRRIELDWLVGAEREFPFELPDLRELAHWYAFSLIPFPAAFLAAWGSAQLLRIRRRQASPAAVQSFFFL